MDSKKGVRNFEPLSVNNNTLNYFVAFVKFNTM